VQVYAECLMLSLLACVIFYQSHNSGYSATYKRIIMPKMVSVRLMTAHHTVPKQRQRCLTQQKTVMKVNTTIATRVHERVMTNKTIAIGMSGSVGWSFCWSWSEIGLEVCGNGTAELLVNVSVTIKHKQQLYRPLHVGPICALYVYMTIFILDLSMSF